MLAAVARTPVPIAATLAAAEARVLRRLGLRGATTQAVTAVFGAAVEGHRGLADAIASNTLRTNVLRMIVDRRGVGAMRRHVRVCGDGPLRRQLEHGGALLVLAPWGPRLAAASALDSQGADVSLVADIGTALLASTGIAVIRPGADTRGATAALQQAVRRIRAGGVVVMAPDGEVGEPFVAVPLLDGTIELRRGLASLARLTSAPVFPVYTAWRTGRTPLEVTIGAPLIAPPSAGKADEMDRELLVRLVEEFEAVLRVDPGVADVALLNRIARIATV